MGIPELSLDLIVLITKEVKDRQTLLSLCRTCKSLNTIASPLLYSELQLDISEKGKEESMALIRRVLDKRYVDYVSSLKIRGDHISTISEAPVNSLRDRMSIASLIDPVSTNDSRNQIKPKTEEPLLDFLQQCTKLQKLTWEGLSTSHESLRSIATGLPKLLEVYGKFKRSEDESEIESDSLVPYKIGAFRSMMSLELYNLADESDRIRDGIVEILFANPGVRKLGFSLDLDWLARRREYDSNTQGVDGFFFVDVVNKAIRRKEHSNRRDNEYLLTSLEELSLGSGFLFPQYDEIRLHELINLSTLRFFHHENTEAPFYDWEHEEVDNYASLCEHALNLEVISAAEISENVLTLAKTCTNLRLLKAFDAPGDYRYKDDSLMAVMERTAVECERWDANLWYRNRKEKGGDPYAYF